MTIGQDAIILKKKFSTLSLLALLSTSEAREKRVLFKQRCRANDPPLFLFRPGTSIAQCGKNSFETAFEFYPTSDLTWQFLKIYTSHADIFIRKHLVKL